MTPRVKSALLLALTLLIGMVLGALLNARLAEQRLERLAFLRTQRGFTRFLERAITPRDEAQREAVRAVLERSAVRLSDHMQRSRAEMEAILDSTRAELQTVLTDEQMEQLEQRLQMRPPDRRDRRLRRGPPPGRPPR
jgi:hypothetical protein